MSKSIPEIVLNLVSVWDEQRDDWLYMLDGEGSKGEIAAIWEAYHGANVISNAKYPDAICLSTGFRVHGLDATARNLLAAHEKAVHTFANL